MNEFKIIIDDSFEDLRIDKLLAVSPFMGDKKQDARNDFPKGKENDENSYINGMSRSFIRKMIDNGDVLVNGKPVKASFVPKYGDEILLNLPEMIVPDIVAENIPLDIVYEDDDVIVINKPKGMVVHPAAGNYTGTIVNALMYHCKDNLSGINGVLRPGIVHRIDKDTTGLIVAAKNDNAHRCLAEQLKEHSITRRYQAICCGAFKEPQGRVEATIGRSPNDRKKMAANVKNGKEAATNYRVLGVIGSNGYVDISSDNANKKNTGNNGSTSTNTGIGKVTYSHIECILETGRTHQIRVHMAYIGHPLLGDFTYGPFKEGQKVLGVELQGQCLHAGVLGFVHPTTGEYMEFEAPLPEYFQKLLSK